MKSVKIAGCALVLLIGTAMLPGFASAQNTFDQNVGCGLGTIIMKERDSTLFQVLAVTTNQILGNQTFGITSGTLECRQPADFAGNKRLGTFVAANMESLAQDMASGGGEALSTVAELMDIPAGSRPAFYSSLQASFSLIFTSSAVESPEVVEGIYRVASNS